MEEKIKKYWEIKEKLHSDLNREPLDEEIAMEMNLKIEEVLQLKQFRVEEEPEEDFQLRFKLTIKNHEMEKARILLNLRQEDLGNLIGVAGVTISHIESCRVYPILERAEKIAKALKSSVNILFPEWLKIFSKQWNDAEKSRIVPVSQLSLSSPEVRRLEAPKTLERDAELGIARKIIGKSLENLMPREKKILELRFGFDGSSSHTYEEVAKELGVTRERIRQIEAKALEKIRNSKGKEALKEVAWAL